MHTDHIANGPEGCILKMENKRSGLIGHPLGHSISPVIHNYLGKRLGIDVDYTLMDTLKENLEEQINNLAGNAICGVNVTVPYKTDVIKFLSEADESVSAIGACNTIVIRNGISTGYNTDYLGIGRAFEDYGITLKDKRVAIIGAGGASKAVRYLCESEGAREILQFNRTVRENNVLPLTEASACAARSPFDVVIQSTSVGMYPNCDDLIIEDPSFYENSLAGYDIIYNPLETRFMKMMRQSGHRSYNGLRMLLYQGVEAFKLFNDVPAIDHEIEMDCFLNMLISMNDRALVLCGMMGCGKSTIGRRLSADTGYDFIDTDDFIESREGTSINEIFAQKGEDAFRKMEHETLVELNGMLDKDPDRKYVISLGGGMCTPDNIPLIRSLGVTVYLRQDAVTLASRLKNDTQRPLLKDDDTLKTITELLNKREALYEEASDEIVDY